MAHAGLVAVGDTGNELLEEVARLLLRKAPRSGDAVEELPTCCVLRAGAGEDGG